MRAVMVAPGGDALGPTPWPGSALLWGEAYRWAGTTHLSTHWASLGASGTVSRKGGVAPHTHPPPGGAWRQVLRKEKQEPGSFCFWMLLAHTHGGVAHADAHSHSHTHSHTATHRTATLDTQSHMHTRSLTHRHTEPMNLDQKPFLNMNAAAVSSIYQEVLVLS